MAFKVEHFHDNVWRVTGWDGDKRKQHKVIIGLEARPPCSCKIRDCAHEKAVREYLHLLRAHTSRTKET